MERIKALGGIPAGLCIALSAAGISTILFAGEDTLPGLLLLLGEPVLWMLLAGLLLWGLMRRKLIVSTAASCAWLLLVLGARTPATAQSVDLSLPGPSPTVRACAAHAVEPTGPLRVVSWNSGGQPLQAAEALLDLDADLYVVQELRSPEDLDALSTQLQGTASEVGVQFAEAFAGAGTGLVVREGWFGVCGSAQEELWTQELGAQGERRALSTLSFPVVDGVGMVPLISVHADRPAGPMELPGWPDTLAQTGAQLARTAAALEAPGVVVLGDTNSHGTFRQMNARMRGAGLAWTGGGASWPARLGPVPMLPLYQLDRAWTGRAWQVDSVRTARLGASDHLGLVVDLIPNG